MPARGPPADPATDLARHLPIIAIGASAGGLEAASRLFDAISAHIGAEPANSQLSGAAFILVQHLDPTHQSLLTELLAEHTAMQVAEASDGCRLAADHVYIIPPGRYMSVSDGALHLSAPPGHQGVRLPFDHLLASLARGYGPQTIAVILSGTGADGSVGLAALSSAGGTIIAQSPEEAEYAGMPQNAIATGLVDQTLVLARMPLALDVRARMIGGLEKTHSGGRVTGAGPQRGDAVEAADQTAAMAEILALLKQTTAQDFSQYKPGTIGRRIERRMGLLAIAAGDLAGYLALLRKEPAECEQLARDLLINVTNFFRDPKVFETLDKVIIPELIGKLAPGQALRIWVAGCSTGEEAYSIAMVCLDAIHSSGSNVKLQIFASDVDADAIATAREGIYPPEIAANVPADRLARYFTHDETGYHVTPVLRSDVVFAVQDVLSDPPFSRMDLVSCRNLLIYLNLEAQAKAIALFHFALREGGVLMLGASETPGKAESRFESIAAGERFYRHVGRSRPGEPGASLSFGEPPALLAAATREPQARRQTSLADICAKAVLAVHAPAAVLINRERHVMFSMGQTGRYLCVAPGYASLDILSMAPPALRTKLRLAIDKATEAGERVTSSRTRMNAEGAGTWFSIDVAPLADEDRDLLLVCFIDEAPQDTAGTAPPGKPAEISRIAELEHDLDAAQAELHAAIQGQETANQEHKAINEEAQSVNEEFQSTNEELLTSKEELQSLNEELTALNSQLQETLDRQRLASDDLQNVLYSTNVATLFLDRDLKIRFFTPAIKALFAVIPGDIGRPIADLRSIAMDGELLPDAGKVLADKVTIEREVAVPGDIWFLRRIFPYITHKAQVQGVVITFADITERKAVDASLEATKAEAVRANLAKSRFLAAASHDLRQPLQSLILLQELLVQSVEGDKPKKLLGRFGQTLGAMSGMLNALLDINQIEAGAVQPKRSAFAIADVFDRLGDAFNYMTDARGLTLRIVPTKALIESDPRLLEQMLRNLLGNAIKYTPHGKILLGCRRRGPNLHIEVWDSGIGIAMDELHAIFEEFHQVDNFARERSRGLGLGLSIVQRLGRLLGHEIGVRSVPGKGSVFAITVPLRNAGAAGEAEAEAEAEADDTITSRRGSCKILVVDDDPDVLGLLEQLLVADGYTVRVAADGNAALSMVASSARRPEILLTDYNLPAGMNGLELIGRLRKTLNHALPAIILTGDITTESMAKIAAQDCIRLSKPVDPRELVKAIERLRLREVSQSASLPSLPAAPATAPTADPAPEAVPQPGFSDGTGPVTYVIDDDAEIRALLREMLDGHGYQARDYDSAEAFLAGYRPGGEACLLVDAHMPGMSGVELLEALRGRGDHVPVILITGDGDVGLAVDAMRSGACDFIEKPVGSVELLASITRVIDQARGIRLIDAANAAAAAHVSDLTSRQREVMAMVLAGHPSKNIAADLGISQRTVENHRAAIMHRMEVKSLPELARMVLRAEGAGGGAQPPETPATEVIPG